MSVSPGNDQPLVSVCIPAYNAGPFIVEAVDSVLAQTYPHVEVICIDDGSTDDTAEILNGYGSSISFESTPNGGAQVARNLALAKARGEYVYFLDADNYLLPDCIRLKMEVASKTGADLVFSNQIVLKDSGEQQHVRARKSPEGMDPFVYCLLYNVPGGTTAIDTNVALHRTSVVRRVGGFRVGVARCHDKDLTLRVTAAGATLAYLDEELSVYRDHAGPRITSVQMDLGYPLDFFVDLIPLIAQSEVYDLNEQRSAALREFVLRLAKDRFRVGETLLANRAFELAGTLGIAPASGESLAYRIVRSIMGYPSTELLRARLRPNSMNQTAQPARGA